MNKRYESSWESMDTLAGYQKILTEGNHEALKTLPLDFIKGWTSKNRGGSVFHYAASHGFSPETTVPFMMECGLDINALNDRGHGVVCHAFNRDADLCLRWFNALLAAGWDVSTMPDGGASLLGRAVEFRRDSLVEGLIRAGVRKFSPGMFTEQYAQTGVSADVVRVARLEPEDEPTTSMQLVEALLPSTQEDITRLFVCAVARCRLSWAHYFIERGADLGFRFPGGATPLHLLARHASIQSNHHEEVMALVFDLVRLGVDPLHTDVAGQTASQRFGQLHRGGSSSHRHQERWEASLRNAQAHAMMSSSSAPAAANRPRARL